MGKMVAQATLETSLSRPPLMPDTLARIIDEQLAMLLPQSPERIRKETYAGFLVVVQFMLLNPGFEELHGRSIPEVLEILCRWVTEARGGQWPKTWHAEEATT